MIFTDAIGAHCIRSLVAPAGHWPGAGVVFSWQTSRAAAFLEQILPPDFLGTLQCDDYSAYDAFARSRGAKIQQLGNHFPAGYDHNGLN